jgi:RNA polymerase sigma factor (sigma-70 family)
MPPTDIRPRPSRAEIDPAALEIVRRHGDDVMASARRWAETPEDAEDAFQRGLEIMLTKAPSTDPDHLVPWLKTVVKREAWSIRRQRERHTPPAPEFAELDSPGPTTAHDQAECFEQLHHGAEAMGRLKPHEVRALALKAEGLTYREICEETGWTYTKVNRALSEGRKAFTARLAGIESGAECERLAPLLSAVADGETRAEELAVLRPHLRTCLACRARLREYRAAPAKVAALVPPVTLGSSLLDPARELFQTASGWLHERGAALAVRWHQAAELTMAHKGAAVVASAAMLGGGGVATVATVQGRPDPARRAASAAAAARTSPQAPSAVPGIAAPATPPDRDDREQRVRDTSRPAKRPAPNHAKRAPEPSPPPGEFTPDSPPPIAVSRQPEQPPAARPEPSGGSGGGEFAP